MHYISVCGTLSLLSLENWSCAGSGFGVIFRGVICGSGATIPSEYTRKPLRTQAHREALPSRLEILPHFICSKSLYVEMTSSQAKNPITSPAFLALLGLFPLTCSVPFLGLLLVWTFPLQPQLQALHRSCKVDPDSTAQSPTHPCSNYWTLS